MDPADPEHWLKTMSCMSPFTICAWNFFYHSLTHLEGWVSPTSPSMRKKEIILFISILQSKRWVPVRDDLCAIYQSGWHGSFYGWNGFPVLLKTLLSQVTWHWKLKIKSFYVEKLLFRPCFQCFQINLGGLPPYLTYGCGVGVGTFCVRGR